MNDKIRFIRNPITFEQQITLLNEFKLYNFIKDKPDYGFLDLLDDLKYACLP